MLRIYISLTVQFSGSELVGYEIHMGIQHQMMIL